MEEARRNEHDRLKSWMLPVIVAALVVPLSLGFILGGPAIGLLAGLVAVVAVVVVALRRRF